VTEIGSGAFFFCYSLRNVAIPPNAALANDIFINREQQEMINQHLEGQTEEHQRLIKKCSWTDLQRLFGGSEERIVRELRHRFDGLPIHKLVYYHTYYQGVIQILIDAMNTRSGQCRTLRSKLDPTGNYQDCLGMTPLHILACSSSHNLELYRVLIERYHKNLITEDRWGALPLLYAFWGDAPAEIIEFLLESYHTLYPGFEFNWTLMMETMGRTDTPKESIENLLHVRQFHFPEQPIDWEYLLHEFVKLSDFYTDELFQERMRFLVMCGMSERVKGLAFKVWRDHIRQMIHTADFNEGADNVVIMSSIQLRLSRFTDELPKLKDVTTILELALWKNRINENNSQHTTIDRRKKIKTGDASIRRLCRVTCGADVIIGHVLPYLISTGNDESLS
jgi:hypothetical protein